MDDPRKHVDSYMSRDKLRPSSYGGIPDSPRESRNHGIGNRHLKSFTAGVKSLRLPSRENPPSTSTNERATDMDADGNLVLDKDGRSMGATAPQSGVVESVAVIEVDVSVTRPSSMPSDSVDPEHGNESDPPLHQRTNPKDLTGAIGSGDMEEKVTAGVRLLNESKDAPTKYVQVDNGTNNHAFVSTEDERMDTQHPCPSQSYDHQQSDSSGVGAVAKLDSILTYPQCNVTNDNSQGTPPVTFLMGEEDEMDGKKEEEMKGEVEALEKKEEEEQWKDEQEKNGTAVKLEEDKEENVLTKKERGDIHVHGVMKGSASPGLIHPGLRKRGTDISHHEPSSTSQETTTERNGCQELGSYHSNDTVTSSEDRRRHCASVHFAEDEQNISQGGESVGDEIRHSEAESRQYGQPLGSETSEHDLFLAATYLRDARHGRSFRFKTSEKHLRSYEWYNKAPMRWTLYLIMTLNLSLAIFEEPAVGNLGIPYWGTMIMEIVCLAYFGFRLCHSKYCSSARWFRDSKNVISLAVIVLTAVDMVSYTIVYEVVGQDKAVRWSRALRPVLMVTFVEMKVVRLAFSNIRKTAVEIMYVLVLLFLVIAIFALLGREMFENKMPAYDRSSWYLIYFFFYIFISIYMFMSIFLAIIYKNYRKHLKNEVQRTVFNKRRKVASAWEILKEWNGGHFVVSWGRWRDVVGRTAPQMGSEEVRLLWKALDRHGSNYIDKGTFMKTSDIICVPIVTADIRPPLIERQFPGCYNCKASLIIRKIVAHRFFTYAFDLLIVANAFCIGFEVDDAEPVFLALFSLEILLRIYSRGVVKFFGSVWNVFDFVVIGTALILFIIEVTMQDFASGAALDIILVIRVLRLVRVINQIERFHVIVETVINIGYSILTFGAVFLVVFYMFAIVGMELYAGRIKYYGYNINGTTNLTEEQLNCGNMALKDSDFVGGHYCNNNFNDIMQAFVILVELMIVNQWHVIAEGYVLVSNRWSRLFFIGFHIGVVIVLVNIFIAFILEVFMVEYSLSKSEVETAMETVLADLGLSRHREGSAINADVPDYDVEAGGKGPDSKRTNVKFTIKRGRNSMLRTLQNMFDGELDVEDIGPVDLESIESDIVLRPVSLRDTV